MLSLFPPPDLMTEMTDLGGQLEAAGIPFLDYGAYALRAFFPGPGGGPGAWPPHHEGRSPALEQGLAQLSGLLNNRTFLLTVSWGGRARGKGIGVQGSVRGCREGGWHTRGRWEGPGDGGRERYREVGESGV